MITLTIKPLVFALSKIRNAILLLSLVATTLPAQDTIPPPVADVSSYSLGVQIGSTLKRQGFQENDFDAKVFAEGVADILAGRKPKVSNQQIGESLKAFDRALQQRMEKAVREAQARMEALAGPNLAKAKAFLAENGKKPGVVTLPSGLQYKIIKKGTGASPAVSSEVLGHYTGRKPISQKVFDSSVQRGSPMKFVPRDMIAGWAEAIPMMKVGSKWILYIPPDLAYGKRGSQSPNPQEPPVIGPNEALEFEVELLEIVKP